MAQLHHPLRVALVQFNPKIGQVKANITKAETLCSKLKPGSLDILCFPEMAFTGYAFDSAKSILPYLEDPKAGPSSVFYQKMAKTLRCYVAGGYPERLGKDDRKEQTIEVSKQPFVDEASENAGLSNDTGEESSGSRSATTTPVGANSAVIYGPDGEWLGGYRKTHLFELDKTWAKPGTGFGSFTLPIKSPDSPTYHLKVSLGICMDLNPRPPLYWDLDGPYELAEHCEKHQSQLLILLNAWLRSGNKKDSADSDIEPDWDTIIYWANRLYPLWRRHKEGDLTDDSHDEDESAAYGAARLSGVGRSKEQPDHFVYWENEGQPHTTTIVVCNRTGTENGYTFAGSSALYSMQAQSGRPKFLDKMGSQEEGVRAWTVFVKKLEK